MAGLTSETVTVIAKQGDVLDRICWDHYGTTSPLDVVLEANPGLSELGAIIPHGTPITLPPLATAAPETDREVSLW